MQMHDLTIAAASALIRDRRLGPVELTEHLLARIDRIDGHLHSYITVTRELAMARARQAEAEIARGGWKGPLHGIPIGLKDLYCTKNIRTTAHSAVLEDHVPAENAVVASALEDAGAILLGKLATWEFAIGGTSHDLPWPPAVNPWNPAHDPGYSSSGSGAAVAAGLALGAMGTDTGGSVRTPAAWCGLAGFKPTYGLVSRRGVVPFVPSLDHCGPMAWTVEDCQLMMDAIAGHDALDPGSARVPRPDFQSTARDGLRGRRVGVVRHYFEEESIAGPETLVATENGIAVLRERGAAIEDVRMPSMASYVAVADVISRSEAFALHEATLQKTPEKYGASARARLAAGAFVRASDYIQALRSRAAMVRAFAALMERFDLLVLPSTPDPAPLLDDPVHFVNPKKWLFHRPFNVLGVPALSACSGFSATGLPLAIQFVGKAFDDAFVLDAGRQFEQETDFRSRRPSLDFLPEALG